MQARGKEVEIMQQLNEKAMTDEETDCDDTDLNVLVKRTPPCRNNKPSKLMKRLDSRKDFKSDTVPKKEHRTGHPSERSLPKGLPKWTLKDTFTSEPYSSSLSNASSPTPSQTISPESPVQFPTQNQGLSPLLCQSSSPTQSQMFSSPRMQNQPCASTPRIPSRGLLCTPLRRNMHFHHGNVGSNGHDTISSENNEDSLSDRVMTKCRFGFGQ